MFIDMNTASTSPQLHESTPELVRKLGLIVAGLAALVARRFLRMPHLVGLTVQLWRRISHVVYRFERALTRPGQARGARAGRRAGGREPGQSMSQSPRQSLRQSLPSGRGWLVRELGYEAAGFGCQLEALLADPAMQAVLIAMPAMGRILRPLCRMLAVPVVAALVAPVVAPVVAPAADVTASIRSRLWPDSLTQNLPAGLTPRPRCVRDG